MLKKVIKKLSADEPVEIKVGDTVEADGVLLEVLEAPNGYPPIYLCGYKNDPKPTWYSRPELIRVEGLVAYNHTKNASLEVFWLCTESANSSFVKGKVYVTDGNGSNIREDECSNKLLYSTPIYKIHTAKFKAMTKPILTNPDYLPGKQPKPLYDVGSYAVYLSISKVPMKISACYVKDGYMAYELAPEGLAPYVLSEEELKEGGAVYSTLLGANRYISRMPESTDDVTKKHFDFKRFSNGEFKVVVINALENKEFLDLLRSYGEKPVDAFDSNYDITKYYYRGVSWLRATNGYRFEISKDDCMYSDFEKPVTYKEFPWSEFDSRPNSIIHCETEAEATALCEIFNMRGRHYADGTSYMSTAHGKYFGANLGYTASGYVDRVSEYKDAGGYVYEFTDYFNADDITPNEPSESTKPAPLYAMGITNSVSSLEAVLLERELLQVAESVKARLTAPEVPKGDALFNPEPSDLRIDGMEPLYHKDEILAVQHGGAYMRVTLHDINICEDGTDFVYTYYNGGLPRKVMENHLKCMVTKDTTKFRTAETMEDRDAIFKEEPNFVRYRYARLFDGNQVVYLKTCSEDETSYEYEACWEAGVPIHCPACKLALLPRQPYFNLGDTIRVQDWDRFVQAITYDEKEDTFYYDAVSRCAPLPKVRIKEETVREQTLKCNNALDKQPVLVVVTNFARFELEADDERFFEFVPENLGRASRHLTIVVSDKFKNIKELSDKEMKFIIVVPETNVFDYHYHKDVPRIKVLPKRESFMNALDSLSSVDDTNYAKLYWNYL